MLTYLHWYSSRFHRTVLHNVNLTSSVSLTVIQNNCIISSANWNLSFPEQLIQHDSQGHRYRIELKTPSGHKSEFDANEVNFILSLVHILTGRNIEIVQ